MISSYFQRIAKYSAPRFILEVTALAFVSRFLLILPAGIILSALGVDLGHANITSFNFAEGLPVILLSVVIIAPFTETLVFQWLPLNLLALVRIGFKARIILTTLLFAYVHLHEGLINFIGMLPIGFLFVWAFAVRQKESVRQAITVVFIIHGLTNLLALILYALTG